MRNLIIAALVVTGGFAFANDEQKAVDLSVYDANQDGTLSSDEIALIQDEQAKLIVATLDANKDGQIDANEYAAIKGDKKEMSQEQQ